MVGAIQPEWVVGQARRLVECLLPEDGQDRRAQDMDKVVSTRAVLGLKEGPCSARIQQGLHTVALEERSLAMLLAETLHLGAKALLLPSEVRKADLEISRVASVASRKAISVVGLVGNKASKASAQVLVRREVVSEVSKADSAANRQALVVSRAALECKVDRREVSVASKVVLVVGLEASSKGDWVVRKVALVVSRAALQVNRAALEVNKVALVVSRAASEVNKVDLEISKASEASQMLLDRKVVAVEVKVVGERSLDFSSFFASDLTSLDLTLVLR